MAAAADEGHRHDALRPGTTAHRSPCVQSGFWSRCQLLPGLPQLAVCHRGRRGRHHHDCLRGGAAFRLRHLRPPEHQGHRWFGRRGQASRFSGDDREFARDAGAVRRRLSRDAHATDDAGLAAHPRFDSAWPIETARVERGCLRDACAARRRHVELSASSASRLRACSRRNRPASRVLVIRPWQQSGSAVSLREITNSSLNHHHGIQGRRLFAVS